MLQTLPPPKRRPNHYTMAVQWIALNDEPEERDPEVIATLISTQLVADVFEREPEKVAVDVLKARGFPVPDWFLRARMV